MQADAKLSYPTFDISEVYGHNPQDGLGETESIKAHTGCIGCPLVQKGAALERVLANPKWTYLAPQIRELIAAETWPEKWDGTDHQGDEWLPEILSDGSVQPLLFSP